jgi:large subunit ribosomal protein L6
MSRIGKKPVPLPKGAQVAVKGQDLEVKGPKGSLKLRLVDDVRASVEGDTVVVTPVDKNADRARAMWGLSRTLVRNALDGVTKGFTVGLEISGVGYRAQVQGKALNLQLGFSHEIKYAIPEGVQIACEKPTSIAISGADKQKVGQVAAEIRGFRLPEPYKGKGIRYADEIIRRKEGKKK